MPKLLKQTKSAPEFTLKHFCEECQEDASHGPIGPCPKGCKKKHKAFMDYWNSLPDAKGQAIQELPYPRKPTKAEMKDALALSSFFETLDTNDAQGRNSASARLVTAPLALQESEGMYLGYFDYLVDVGSEASHRPNLVAINHAWEMHRQEFLFKPRFKEVTKPQEEEPDEVIAEEKPIKKKQSEGGARTPILGFPATAVVRQLAKAGWKRKRIERVLKHFKVEMSPITIGIKMKDWSDPKNQIATLKKSQVKELLQLVTK